MSDVNELEFDLKNYEVQKLRLEQAERLSRNSDFRLLIIDGFCRDEAARFVQGSADPMLSAEERADSLNMAQASGHLKRWLQFQIRMGQTAEKNIAEIEQELVELRSVEGAE